MWDEDEKEWCGQTVIQNDWIGDDEGTGIHDEEEEAHAKRVAEKEE